MMLITGKSGFALIELVVVIAIISLVSFLVVFSGGDFFPKTRLESSAENIAALLRWARRLAITKRKRYEVVFDLRRKTYWVEDGETHTRGEVRRLEKNVIFADPHLGKVGEEDGMIELDDPDDDSFLFYPEGTAEAGSIYLWSKDSKRWYTVTIALNGYVRVYPEKH
ncbi:prepilin-type N-terminal cleavage/methylation domain-containing protein [Candidatus Aerophobetes bacterium]|nr:prepilin-type N-terminal cleavage/methylation domain-containing protein [Candidatus Aerophobetes bacterium]